MLGTWYLFIIFGVLVKVKSALVQKTIYIDTTGGRYYQIIPIDWFVKSKRINIRVQALEDASFALLRDTDDTKPILEVLIGAEQNTKCYIKKNNKIIASVDTPGILDPSMYKGFWISWYTNSKSLDLKTLFMVRIGLDGDDSPLFFTWHSDPGPPATAYYIGVRTNPKSGSGFWEMDVMYNETNITSSVKEVETKSVPRREPIYRNFYRISNQRIEFKVKVLQDAWICLSKNPQKIVNKYYQVVIGGWGNKKCAIFTEENQIVAVEECDGALNSKYYHGFWISLEYIDDILIILVGRDGEVLPFMKYVEFTGILPMYYSVACTGYDRIGYWILKVPTQNVFKYVKTVTSKPVTYLSFEPIPKYGLIHFKTKVIRDAWIGITSSPTNDPDFEIILGGWNNTKCTIRRKGEDIFVFNQLDFFEIGPYAGFWMIVRPEESMFLDVIRNIYINIQVGREDEKIPFLKYHFLLNITENRIFPKFYSVGSTMDTEYVSWILEASVRRLDFLMPKYYVSYDNPSKYHLYALEGQRVEFDIKTAKNGIITLTTSSHKPHIEISLFNKIIKIFKDGILKESVETDLNISNEVYQGFWIDWKYNTKPKSEMCLCFGKEKYNRVLLKWCDTEPFLIKYIGADSRNGIGYWKFYDAWVKQESEKFMPNLIRTYNNPKGYQFFPIIQTPIRFRVKSGRDANLAFTSSAEREKPIIEVLLGAFGEGWKSQYTYIRKDFQHGSPGEIFIKTPNILRADKFVEFWINWEYIDEIGREPKMRMQLGLEGENALLSWEGKDFFPISYVGVTGYRSNAIWIFEDDIEIIEKKKWKEVVTNDNESYQFFPVLAKPLWIQVKASYDACIALASTKVEKVFPILEFIIGTDSNKKTAISLNRDELAKYDTIGILSNSYYESFWFDWDTFKDVFGETKMTVYIGRRADHRHFASWIIDPFDINYFGLSSKGNTAFWHFQEMAQILPPYIHTYNHSNQYQFYLAPNHTLIFYIKAASDAYIALATTNSSTETSMYEIMIGAEHNQKSFIKKNKTIPLKDEQQITDAHTENILSSTELRGFWMDWIYMIPPLSKNEGLRIRVGHQGEVHPFLKYQDNNPFSIKFIGFTSGCDTSLWKFDEVIEETLSENINNNDVQKSQVYDFAPENYTQITTGNFTYQFFSLPAKNMSFKVKTQSDIYIFLLSRPQIYSLFPMYEILIGGRNKITWIKRSNGNPKKIVNTPLALNFSEFRGFWVSWVDGNIEAGFMDKKEAFLRWTDPDPFEINFIGVTSRYSAVWQIIDTTIQTHDDKHYFFPIAADKTMFLLKGSENAKIILTNNTKAIDPIIEIILGTRDNTEITFRRENLSHTKKVDGILEKNVFRGYWVSWAMGKFTVGVKGEPHPIAFFDDPTPVSPNYIAIAGNEGSTITWQFKVAPAWKPIQWDSENDNPCVLDPNGQECIDRTLALEMLKNREDRDKRIVNDCDSERWRNAFQCNMNKK